MGAEDIEDQATVQATVDSLVRTKPRVWIVRVLLVIFFGLWIMDPRDLLEMFRSIQFLIDSSMFRGALRALAPESEEDEICT